MPDKSFKDVCKELQECRQQKTPKSIPEIFGIQYKEVYITQWLGYLLDPNKNGLGSLCLMPLNALLLAGGYDEISSDTNIKEIKVYTEYVFENNRRIDIYIETPECLIGIENKICSDEQKNQTHDYSESLKKISDNSKGIYLYPEWNKQVNPKGIFHAVTYKKLHEELMKIDLEDINDRNHWILNEFMKYVEENLMEAYPEFTKSARVYYENLPTILPAQEEYEKFADDVEAWLLNNLPTPFISYNRKINGGWWAIVKDEKWKDLFFHYEIIWQKENPIAVAEELEIVIHLETKNKDIIDFFKNNSGKKWQSVRFTRQHDTYTLCSTTINGDFENQIKAKETLDKIVKIFNSEELKFWSDIADEYIRNTEQ